MKQDDPRRPWWLAARDLVQRLFPDRQIVLRTEGHVSYIRLSTRRQVVFVSLGLLALGWAAFGVIVLTVHKDIVAEKNQWIEDNRRIQKALQDKSDYWERAYRGANENLEAKMATIRGLASDNSALRGDLEKETSRLKDAERERDRILAEQAALDKKINGLRGTMASTSTDNDALKDNLTTTRKDLRDALADRNQVMVEANRMRRQIAELETRLTHLQDLQLDTVQRLHDQTNDLVDGMERIVDLAGLRVSDLVGEPPAGVGGQGGPFVPMQADGLPAGRLKASLGDLDNRLDQWQRLQSAVRQLPLSAPLTYFHVTSPFGKRPDPVNGKWAMHYGLDMASTSKRDPVLATAPGVVEFAGWRGNYGKVVEIDHGSGIKTRYGHLHKILVKKGDTVKFHEKVGLVGNTGRTTGSHLHYEIAVNGRPRDPSKFIMAGRYVFQE